MAINIVSILFSVLSFKIQPYRYVMPFDHFFYDDGTFNEKAIEEYRDEPSVDVFKDTIIEIYLRCIKDNGLTNKGKAIKVKIAQWLFFAGVITIPIAIGILLLNFPKTVSQ